MSSRTTADRALPWFVFGVLVLVAAVAALYVWNVTRAADRARFDNAVQSASDALTSRLDTYTNVLTATRSLVISDPTLPRETIRSYIRNLNIQRRYPGIQGVGVSIRIPADHASQLVAEMRRSGFPEFHIWPDTPRSEIHAIVLLEPPDRRNRAAMGYDMFTEPVRRQAMERARDRGRPSASGRVTLVQEIDVRKQPGFLLYTPLYATGVTPPTLEQRRQALVGFIYAPFRAWDLLNGLFGSQRRPEIGFEILDNGELLYRSQDLPSHPRFVEEAKIEVAGRQWTIHWISRRHGHGTALRLALATFAGGLVIALLLLTFLRFQQRAREEAEETAERLRESEAALQRANAAKDDFLATLSHELRTPMTAIMGWSQMLSDENFDPGTEKVALEAIRNSAKVQAQLIDDLLDVSRITAGKMRIERERVELAPVIGAAVDTIRAAAAAKGIRLTSELEGELFVEGDSRRLQQVTWNLLSNAVKFTRRGGEVRVVLREEDGAAVIEVHDTGIGIDPAFMPYIFDRFRQADSSSTRAHMGLGLGLAIVRHLVEAHGGTIAAESKGLGRGSTFRVRLPTLRVTPRQGATQEDDSSASVLRGTRLLVVDDDEDVRMYVATVFRRSGADVKTAASAREALHTLREWQADLVLTDLAMPEQDGFALLEAIRAAEQARWRDVPVVALTAFASPEDRQHALDAGFHAFVAKPVQPSQLRRAVSVVLQHRDEHVSTG